MREDRFLTLLTRFAEPATRRAAASELARSVRVDDMLVFVRDGELGVLLPAPGFPQTINGGPVWRAFLRSCVRAGVYTGDVDYPSRENLTPVVAHVLESGIAVLLFGGPADEAELTHARAAFPLLSAMLRSEHAARLARGEAEVARASGRHASDLAHALDQARSELEGALADAARLNDELQDTDRRKDDFMAMLGHELRNPMAAISGAIEVMRARPEDLIQTQRAREIIERQTEQLARLVDDLLDVARITRGKITLKRAVLEVEPVARRAIDAAHTLVAAKQHQVDLEVYGEVYATADPTRLEQMIANLLTNAAKYTDPGGHILVTVKAEGSEAVVSIADDGIGIAPDMLPRIFDPFLQVEPSIDRAAGGLGVGLTVVSRLAALHGGRVEATSELGKGSVFTLRVPVSVAPERMGPVSEPEPEPPRSRIRKRVLVVDDNVDTGEMIVTLAENWGHEAFHATDGPGAVAMALDLKPDIVLLDIGLPGMDGYEVAAKLRDDVTTSSARIIALSGYGMDADRLKSRAAGCDDHLVKPVDLAVLKGVLAG